MYKRKVTIMKSIWKRISD